jgi:hypothetical protein
MAPTPLWVTVGALSVWRVTHLLAFEDGPARFLQRVRALFDRAGLGSVFGCFYCLSVWIALPFAAGLGSTVGERLLLWPGLSAAACLLERWGQPAGPDAAPAVHYEGVEEENHAMLRRRAIGDDPPGE